jgi:hypothetical protein
MRVARFQALAGVLLRLLFGLLTAEDAARSIGVLTEGMK